MIPRFAPALTLLLAGCGALFNGGPSNVALNSDPSGAQVMIDGTSRGTTPTTLALAKNKSYTITFHKEGFQDATAQIDRKVSAGYVVLDVLGSVLPVVIDAATGSWYTLSTNNVSVNLRNASAMHGQLAPEQLAAVKAGKPLQSVLTAEHIMQARD
jgi:hypothetical protein